MNTITLRRPKGFIKILHERITSKGIAETYAKLNNYPTIYRTKK